MKKLITKNKATFSAPSKPVLLYRTYSKDSGLIEVWQKGYEKQLVVGGLVQSVSADTPTVKQRVWGKIVQAIFESVPDPSSCLLLGLGGGAVAHLLSRKVPHINITAVEIDPVIISVGKTYFELRQLPNLKVIQGDAAQLVTSSDVLLSSYDAIVIDTFFGEAFSAGCTTPEFIVSLGKLLSPHGVLVFNQMFSLENQERVRNFEQLIRVSFSNVSRQAVIGLGGGENALITARGFKRIP